MKFDKALNLMKNGTPMKRPSWGGYWEWDSEQKTIMMHCRETDSDTGKAVMDIRETRRVEYTLKGIMAEDWEAATAENCTVLGGTPYFDFGTAIQYLKRGMRLRREGWNGKAQYILLAHDIRFHSPNGTIVKSSHEGMGSQAIAFVGTRGVQIGWLASQSDMLADDWTFAD